MSEQHSIDLLNAIHQFPCPFTVKVIGKAHEAFVAQVLAAVQEVVGPLQTIPHHTRQTPAGRHLSITLEPHVDSAEQVLAIYRRVQQVEGIVITM